MNDTFASRDERQGAILQNRTEINHTQDALMGNLRPCQIALEIPFEDNEDEDNLPRVVFRGLEEPYDDPATPDDYHRTARLDELRRHTNDMRIHVPLIDTDPPYIWPPRKYLRSGGLPDYPPTWETIEPNDLPISGIDPISYNANSGEITHKEQLARDAELNGSTVYNKIKVDGTGHVTDLQTRTLDYLTPGDGILGNTYNTGYARTWNLDFTQAGGDHGVGVKVARGDHNHDYRYALIDHDHADYVSKAGDTMTGQLQFAGVSTAIDTGGGAIYAGYISASQNMGISGPDGRGELLIDDEGDGTRYRSNGIQTGSAGTFTIGVVGAYNGSLNHFIRTRLRLTSQHVYAEKSEDSGATWPYSVELI
jgi:hypothetical protein